VAAAAAEPQPPPPIKIFLEEEVGMKDR